MSDHVQQRFLGFAISPMTARRLKAFRSNERGFTALIIFLFLFGCSLFAEFIANDRPILLRYDGAFYMPVLVDYPETTFGGSFKSFADYRDPSLQKRINEKGWMVWPMIPFGATTVVTDLPGAAPSPPDGINWLGTDDQARDVLARVIYGFRISVLFGLALTAISTVFGILAGATQGYFGGWLDLLGQRFLEVWSGLPTLYILMILASVMIPGFWTLLGINLLVSWTWPVAYVRAEFLRARNLEYVRAARALGLSDTRIILRHIMPNALVATLATLPFILGGSVTTLTALDFLGLGMPVGSPSLGDLLSQGKENLQSPWLGIVGFLVIGVMLSLLIFIGEAVRDAFDPRKTQ
jgi:microcin C transport system permease protein